MRVGTETRDDQNTANADGWNTRARRGTYYKKKQISCNENSLFNVLALALCDDYKYGYELRKTIYSYVEHKQEYFKRYLTEENIDDYIKEMRRATTSGWE